jgi:hypothetical protein
MANSELRAGERGQRRKMYRDSLTAVPETLRDGRSSQGRRSDGSVGGWQPIEDWPFFGTLDRQSAVRPKVPSVGWPGCAARDTCCGLMGFPLHPSENIRTTKNDWLRAFQRS